MAKLLFDLRNVPDDEADEVRALLEGHQIEFYETKPAAWGLFGGGLWLVDEALIGRAKALLSAYQAQRAATARAEHAAARRAGTAETLWTSLRREPGRVLVLLLSIVFLVALTVLPFLLFGRLPGAN